MIDPDKPGATALAMLSEYEQRCTRLPPPAPAAVLIDLRLPADQRATLDPEWEWHDVSRLGDPPWIRQYVPGFWKGPR